jgi:hypothetical protein
VTGYHLWVTISGVANVTVLLKTSKRIYTGFLEGGLLKDATCQAMTLFARKVFYFAVNADAQR